MATTVQFRRKNTSNTAAFTGANGEISVDTDKKTLVVHDGVTAGGVELMRADANNASINAITYGTGLVTNSSGVFVGTSTTNAVINSSAIVAANSTQTTTVAAASIIQGNTTVNSISNSSSLILSSATTAGLVNTSAVTVGNSTINVAVNSSSVAVSGSGNTGKINASALSIGNSTVNVAANSTTVTAPAANITANAGLTLGSSNASSVGYTYLPNGIKMAWGAVTANSTESTITFANTFTTVWSIVATTKVGNGTYNATHQVLVLTSNTSSANVKTGNADSVTVSYTVIGN